MLHFAPKSFRIQRPSCLGQGLERIDSANANWPRGRLESA
jgi:hypothetical protein